MFKKYVTNLAFSPAGIEQISFYANRLKQEESIRRLGLILVVISMFIQIFAAMVPPEKSLAASNNDVIAGGVTSIGQLKSKYEASPSVKALYNRFGLQSNSMNTTGSVQNVTFNFAQQGAPDANGQRTRTVGRINFTTTNDTYLGNLGGSNFYSRNAGEWPGSTPAYFFGKQKGTDGRYYYVWVLKDCGNIAYRPTDGPPPGLTVSPPTYTPPAPTPAPKPVPVPTPTPNTPPPVVPPVAPPPVVPPKVPEPVCENDPTLKPDDEKCKCIDNPKIPATDEKCTTPQRSKAAINVTQNLTAAQTVTTAAKPGNVIEYTLTTTNVNIVEKKGYVVEDYIGDIIEYADLDMTYIMQQGGTYDATTKKLIWKDQTLPAKGKLVKTFRVVVKPIIPSTNRPSASATDYDCKMQNGYGSETIIPVDCSPLKTVEQLPNTGPGTTISIAVTVSVLSGYFFMRSRLLAKEMTIIKRTYQTGTGF